MLPLNKLQRSITVARRKDSGVATLLFTALILPLSAVMLTVTVDFARFFSVRDELQRVLDSEVHEALVSDLSQEQIDRDIRTRMSNVAGMADISSLTFTRDNARGAIAARARYSGPFFQFVEGLTGEAASSLPIFVRSQARIQSATSLIILDRTIDAGANPCADAGWRSVVEFISRLNLNWSERVGSSNTIAVAPGVNDAVQIVSNQSIDELARCSGLGGSESAIDLLSVEASRQGAIDPIDLAFAVRDLASTQLFSQTTEVRSVLLVLRRQSYDLGTARAAFNLLQESAHELPFPVEFYALVVDDSKTIDFRPLTTGINGGAYRELGASISELGGTRLLTALSKTVTDRIVLEN